MHIVLRTGVVVHSVIQLCYASGHLCFYVCTRLCTVLVRGTITLQSGQCDASLFPSLTLLSRCSPSRYSSASDLPRAT